MNSLLATFLASSALLTAPAAHAAGDDVFALLANPDGSIENLEKAQNEFEEVHLNDINAHLKLVALLDATQAQKADLILHLLLNPKKSFAEGQIAAIKYHLKHPRGASYFTVTSGIERLAQANSITPQTERLLAENITNIYSGELLVTVAERQSLMPETEKALASILANLRSNHSAVNALHSLIHCDRRSGNWTSYWHRMRRLSELSPIRFYWHLSRYPRKDREALPFLYAGLQSQSRQIRNTALEALKKIGPYDQSSILEFRRIALATEPNTFGQIEAAELLSIHRTSPESVKLALRIAQNNAETYPHRAAEILGNGIVSVLRSQANEPFPRRAYEMLKTLAEFPDNTNLERENVRIAALQNLGEVAIAIFSLPETPIFKNPNFAPGSRKAQYREILSFLFDAFRNARGGTNSDTDRRICDVIARILRKLKRVDTDNLVGNTDCDSRLGGPSSPFRKLPN